jgi:hypothetical protein
VLATTTDVDLRAQSRGRMRGRLVV